MMVGLLPLIILGTGWWFVTQQRVNGLRKQLTQIIETLEAFDLNEPKKVVFEKSTYALFNELNENILELIDRIRSNYQADRQFTQNASHELQTPLAIIKGNVEILLNSARIKEQEAQSLGIILQNTNRLARLNHALVLLSKIENSRYSNLEEVDIATVIDEMLSNFHDLLRLQEIEVKRQYTNQLTVKMSATLAEILFANLFQNAICYNVEEGFIAIKIDEKTVTMANSGEVLKVPPETLFKRFQRQSDIEESLGLGLSIVKRICDFHGIDVQYKHHSGLHQLVLRFP